ncbi:hypothetical protein FACS1894211_15400 [Clostridia bacterium]|nr:hypothetical protein FACS1894211_15400 [Clostridia bacterium]
MVLKELTVKKDVDSKGYAVLVQHAMRYGSDVLLEVGVKKINCKSVMGMISLGFRAGDKAVLIIKGEDEEAALADMVDLFESL